MTASDVPQEFQARQPVSEAFNAASASAVAGLVVSAAQNCLQKHKAGAMGVFSRTGGTIAIFTLIGGLFAYSDASLANFRHKEDGWNGAAGGCAAGLVMGAASRSMPLMAGSCAGLGALVGSFQAAGGTMLNKQGIRPELRNIDPENNDSPLKTFSQERRFRFFKKTPETE
ncbi:hypothetical protein MARU1_002274 [Malassezia arunalokei]|uniref:NADH dehydrogenase [ubiquinone] 1 alpha subcomplex subunit 11 n=1 Tax=Malassezia arunalokei TaxID=1514897 RepID=A0AAJ6CN10_9BASI|nr:hypothetical protein MARU1_002274 [Malassezia arunalokei]